MTTERPSAQLPVAVIGAGPYGLSAAAHLRRAGVQLSVFGQPMSFWQSMPAGLLLRSNWTATCIAEHQGELSLTSFCAATHTRCGRPVPLDRFIEYGLWVQQQVAPDVDRRPVRALEPGPGGFRLTLDDGTTLAADLVVRLVERYLAEYRELLQDNPECREALIELLDTFVRAGWPAARQLTYRLEDIFR